jgi:hypothetical protein
MKDVAFLTDYAVVDRIIRHLKLTLALEKPPPSRVFELLTQLRGREYHHLVMGGIGFEPGVRGFRAARKRNFLSLIDQDDAVDLELRDGHLQKAVGP